MSELPPYWNSTVSLEKALADLRENLAEYGAEGFIYQENYKTGDASVQFVYKGAIVRFDVSGKKVAKAFLEAHPWSKKTRKSERKYTQMVNKKAHRAAMRITTDHVLSSLASVDHGLDTFENIFFSHFVLKDEEMLGDYVSKLIEEGHLQLKKETP
jgi:hypothetical protein